MEWVAGGLAARRCAPTRREVLFGALAGLGAVGLSGCSVPGDDRRVVVYSCAEGVRNEAQLAAIRAALPQYDVRLRYITSGNCAARLKMEGTAVEADIVLDLEGGYMAQVSDVMADLSEFDSTAYCPDLLDGTGKSFPFARESACVAVNDRVIAERGLAEPKGYRDLLDPAFKGLICMPNPRSSGTGYNFLKSLVNAWGEDEAFAYFDGLAENVYQFTSSGSGPVNALVQGEAAVGLGMTFQAVSEINQGVPLSVHFFEEGAPWAVYSMGIVSGRQGRGAVREVFGWLSTEGVKVDNAAYVPDQVLVDFKAQIPNYPTDITYADMSGATDPEEKRRLIDRWAH